MVSFEKRGPGPMVEDETQAPSRARPRYGSVVAMLLLGIAAVAATLAIGWREADRLGAEERDTWLTRLHAIAERQRDALRVQGDATMAALADVAANPTIELFLTEYRAHSGDFDRIMDGVEQLDYIANYLEVVAAERGYRVGDGPIDVRANLPQHDARADVPAEAPASTSERPVTGNDSTSLILSEFAFEGIALVNLSGDVVVSTEEFPPLTYDIREFITASARGERHISIAFQAPDGRPTHVSLHPAFAFLDDRTPETQLAWIVGLRLLEEVYDTSDLQHAGLNYATLQSVAVYPSDGGIRALIGKDDPAAAVDTALGDALPAWRLAIDSPGAAAVVQAADGSDLLMASAGFEAVPVAIVTTITGGEALAISDRLSGVILTLAVPGVILAVLAVAMVWAVARRASAPTKA